MGHGADGRNHATPRERLDAAGATDVAATLQALATPHACTSWPGSRKAPARSATSPTPSAWKPPPAPTSCACYATWDWSPASATVVPSSTRCTTTTSPSSWSKPSFTWSIYGSACATPPPPRQRRPRTGDKQPRRPDGHRDVLREAQRDHQQEHVAERWTERLAPRPSPRVREQKYLDWCSNVRPGPFPRARGWSRARGHDLRVPALLPAPVGIKFQRVPRVTSSPSALLERADESSEGGDGDREGGT